MNRDISRKTQPRLIQICMFRKNIVKITNFTKNLKYIKQLMSIKLIV